VVLGRIAGALRRLIEPRGEEAIAVIGELEGLEPLDAQRAFIATYAGTRGLRLARVAVVRSREEAERVVREEGAGRVVLVYSAELLSREAMEKAGEWGVKEIIVVKGSLSGPKMGC
jgi:hypothetical protein